MPTGKPEFIAREKVGEYFPGLNPKTLANLASLGRGPSYFRCSRKVFYRYSDLVEYLTAYPIKTVSKNI